MVSTFKNDSVLPKLSVPNLHNTIIKYLDSVKAGRWFRCFNLNDLLADYMSCVWIHFFLKDNYCWKSYPYFWQSYNKFTYEFFFNYY